MKYTVILLLNLAFCLNHVQAQYDEDAGSVAYHSTVSGIAFQTELGYLFKAEKGEQNRGLSIRQSVSKNLSEFFSVGLGLGYDQYDSQNILPAFVQLKADLVPNERFCPFLSGQGGLGISITADETNELLQESYEYDGGAYYQLGGGLMIHSRENISWIISLAYINQSHSRIRSYNDPVENGALRVEESYTDNRIAVRVGFVF